MAFLALLVIRPQSSQADSHTYFPETGHYLGGGFRDYWNGKGGLSVFGYPITEEYRAANGRVTQWFERARFELASSGAVELGLLGTESTIGRVFPQVPPQTNDANHRYFPETSHLVMWGFKTIWESKGGLAGFGYPISEEMEEILPADGKWHTVQYFERARFEFWPNFKAGERVLVSDLGRRLAPRELTAPLPPGSPPGSVLPPPAPPAPNPGNLPPNVNATVTPPSGPVGTVFAFNGFGFQPGENIALWVTVPDQSVVPADFELTADPDGSITSWGITFNSFEGLPTGIWALTAQGKSSGNAAIGFFLLTPADGPAPPPPGTLPNDQNARIEPREGAPGTVFYFFAGGFVPGENVISGVFNQNGDLVTNTITTPADGNGSLDYARLHFNSSAETPPDIYEIYAVGESGREAFAFMRITGGSPTSLALRAHGSAALSQLSYGAIEDSIER
jgi:hypothetical protein